jgi:hypothetical protein
MLYHETQNGNCHGAFLSFEALICRELTVQLQFNLRYFIEGSRITGYKLKTSNETSYLLAVMVETRRKLALNSKQNFFQRLRRM